MKRMTAMKRINEHLDEYLESGCKYLHNYLTLHPDATDCPLCIAADGCSKCIKWPGAEGIATACEIFQHCVNNLKTVAAKKRWIAKLRVAMDEWVKVEND